MARGTESKNIVFEKIQSVFPDSFWEDPGKILRIPLEEDGTRVEIKVSLTAAKVNLGEGGVKSAFPAEEKSAFSSTGGVTESKSVEPTEEEKANVAKLIASLGL